MRNIHMAGLQPIDQLPPEHVRRQARQHPHLRPEPPQGDGRVKDRPARMGHKAIGACGGWGWGWDHIDQGFSAAKDHLSAFQKCVAVDEETVRKRQACRAKRAGVAADGPFAQVRKGNARQGLGGKMVAGACHYIRANCLRK